MKVCKSRVKFSQIGVFVVFDGGKAYKGTPNRRKQSTRQSTVRAEKKRDQPFTAMADSSLNILCVKDGDLWKFYQMRFHCSV